MATCWARKFCDNNAMFSGHHVKWECMRSDVSETLRCFVLIVMRDGVVTTFSMPVLFFHIRHFIVPERDIRLV